MTYQAIYDALEGAVTTALAGIPLQTPNTYIDPRAISEFARITHLPATAAVATLGTTGQNFRPGLTQIDIFTRAGSGNSTTPDSIVAAFPRGTQYTVTDGDVYEVLAYRDGGNLVEDSSGNGGGFWQERVIVTWSALTST